MAIESWRCVFISFVVMLYHSCLFLCKTILKTRLQTYGYLLVSCSIGSRLWRRGRMEGFFVVWAAWPPLMWRGKRFSGWLIYASLRGRARLRSGPGPPITTTSPSSMMIPVAIGHSASEKSRGGLNRELTFFLWIQNKKIKTITENREKYNKMGLAARSKS